MALGRLAVSVVIAAVVAFYMLNRAERKKEASLLLKTKTPATAMATFDGVPRNTFDQELFVIHPEVLAALREGRPVVALESTIISHGMPWPQNINMAREVEQIVRDNGAVPATIAILDGHIAIGLNSTQLEQLALSGRDATKVSRRDISRVLIKKGVGATTVSATMLLAHQVGIQVFVTGGIGGVHRGVEHSMDVSADLTELGRTPVAVVCAGAKSLLDLPRTLEYLETEGVSVVSLASDQFPAFFVRDSGLSAPSRLDTEKECANLIDTHFNRLRLSSGVVIAVPIPEQLQANSAIVEDAIQQAIALAEEQGIKGKEVTPFMLATVNRLTAGESLKSNIGLVKHNAVVGSKIAKEIAELKKRRSD